MICPVCGFEQTLGSICSQCQTPLSSAPSSALEGSGEGQALEDQKKDLAQSALDGSQSEAVSAKASVPSSTAGGSAGGEENPDPSRADSEAVAERPIQQVEEKSHDSRPEKQGPTKKRPASSGSGSEAASAKSHSLSSASGRSRGEVKSPAPGPEKPWPTKNRSASDGVRERLEQLEHMIVTTTPGIEGGMILAYQGIVTATVLVKGDLLIRQFLQGILGEVASIRSSSLEDPFERAKTIALTDLKVEAAKRGANAVVGLTMSQAPAMEGVWLHLVGTAVTLKE